jgi:hypothetical protein
MRRTGGQIESPPPLRGRVREGGKRQTLSLRFTPLPLIRHALRISGPPRKGGGEHVRVAD